MKMPKVKVKKKSLKSKAKKAKKEDNGEEKSPFDKFEYKNPDELTPKATLQISLASPYNMKLCK